MSGPDRTVTAMELLLMVAATLLSPVIAVQVTVRLDKRKQTEARRRSVFYTLMMTRDAWLSPDHVRALNAIPIEFHGDKKAKTILEAWRAYNAHLNMPLVETDAERFMWANTRADLFVTMVHTIAVYFKYDFDKTFIRTTAYTPRAHGQLEDEGAELRRLLLEVLRGERTLPIASVVQLPAQSATVPPPAPRPLVADEIEALKKQLDAPSEPQPVEPNEKRAHPNPASESQRADKPK